MKEVIKNRVNIYPTYIEVFNHVGAKAIKQIPPMTIFDKPIDISLLHQMGYQVYRHFYGIGLIEQ